MPVSSQKARELHTKLLLLLQDSFTDDNYDRLKQAAVHHLRPGRLEKCKSANQLVTELQSYGLLKIGDYTVLKEMVQMANVNVHQILDQINEIEEEIREQNAEETVPKQAYMPDSDKEETVPKQAYIPDSDKGGAPNPLGTPEYDSGKGLCLILNYKEDRKGTEEDVQGLKGFLESVNCEVMIQHDLSKDQVFQALDEARQMLNTTSLLRGDYKYFLCVILSHGNKDGIRATKGETFTMDTILEKFTNKDFAGKPKIFLIQACQGTDEQEGHDLPDDEPRDMSDIIGKAKIPTDADFLLACATTAGNKAYRNLFFGSWFIYELVEHLKSYHQSTHLEEILLAVRHKVAFGYETNKGVKQMPYCWTTLTKRFYFRKSH